MPLFRNINYRLRENPDIQHALGGQREPAICILQVQAPTYIVKRQDICTAFYVNNVSYNWSVYLLASWTRPNNTYFIRLYCKHFSRLQVVTK